MAALGGGQSVGGGKTLRVGGLQPGDAVLGIVLGHLGVPRHEADGLADIGRRVNAVGLEELVLLIPEFGVYLLLQCFCPVEIVLGLVVVASECGDVADGHGVTIHIAVDAGAQILLLAAATDGLLHGILHVGLPVKAALTGVRLLPVVVLPLQGGQHGDNPVLAPVNEITAPQRIRHPRRVVGNLLHGLAVVALVPGVHRLVEVDGVAQPAALQDVVAHAGGDEVVLVAIGALHEELRHGIAHGCQPDVLAQCPPAEVPQLFEILVGAVEEGHVVRHPLPAVLVGNGLPNAFGLHLVEVVDVVAIVVGAEYGGCPGGGTAERDGRGGDVGDGEGSLGITLAGTIQRPEPVGIGVDVREGATAAGAEHDALDVRYGSEEHALASLLVVDVDLDESAADAEYGFDVVDGIRLVLAQSAVAGTALAAHQPVGRQFQARACRAVLIEKLYLQQAVVVLGCAQVELYAKFIRGRNLALYAGIVEGVAVAQRQPAVLKRDGGIDGGIEVPVGKVRNLANGKLGAVGMAVGLSADGHGDVGHPHVFLVHGIGDPEIGVLRDAVALLDATDVLRSVRLVVAAIAHGRNLALYQVQRGVVEAVAAERDGQRPAVFRGVVDGGIGAIAEALSPDFGIAVDKALSTVDGLGPRQSAVVARAGQGVLPQCGETAVGQRVVAVGLIGLAQRNERVVAVGLLHPLHAVARIGQNLFTGRACGLVGLGVVGEGTRCSKLSSKYRITRIKINEIDGAEGAVFPHLADDAANAVAVVGVVLAVEGHAIVAEGIELAALRHIPADTLVHDSDEVVGFLGAVGLLVALGHLQLREQHLRVGPCVAVRGSLQHGARRWYVLVAGVAQVVDVEAVVPIGHHGLVVVGPAVVVGG